MARYNAKFTPELSKKFCEALEKGHSIEGACGAVGISFQTYRNWYTKGEKAKSGKYKQFICDVQTAQEKATNMVEKVILDNIPTNPQDAKWWLTKRRPDIYADKTYNETKLDANVQSEVTVNLLDKVKQKRKELNDLHRSN